MNTSLTDLKQLAAQIESFAKDIQDKLVSGGDYIIPANELTRSNMALIFSLGEDYALKQKVSSKKISVTTSPGGKSYHNLRDARTGRFVSKV